MTSAKHLDLLVALFLLPVTAFAGNTIYRSVDDAGHVTFSTEPPVDAARTETVRVPPGPSAQETEQAIERVRELEQRSDAQFEALTKRRQQEAQARRDTERLRLDRESAERKRRIDEAAEYRVRQPSYYPAYPLYWRRPHPPHPPVNLPYPPEPARPVFRRPQRSHSHINPPTRRW